MFTHDILNCCLPTQGYGEIFSIIDKLNTIQMGAGYIHADETTLQVLNEKGKTAKQKSYIWLKASTDKHPIILMHYSSNRNEKTAEHLFSDFSVGNWYIIETA